MVLGVFMNSQVFKIQNNTQIGYRRTLKHVDVICNNYC